MILYNVRHVKQAIISIACMQSAKHALTRTAQNAIKKNQAVTILSAQSAMTITILITKANVSLHALPTHTSIMISQPVFLALMAHSMIQMEKNVKTALIHARPASMMDNL